MSFEDALKLMRFGKIMRNSIHYFTNYSVIDGVLGWRICDKWIEVTSLTSQEIMSEWEVV